MPQQTFTPEKVSSVDPACPDNLSVLPWGAGVMEIPSVVAVSQVTNQCFSGLLGCGGFGWWCVGSVLGWFLLAGLCIFYFFLSTVELLTAPSVRPFRSGGKLQLCCSL